MKHYIIIKFKKKEETDKVIESIKTLFNNALNIEGVDDIEIYKSNMDLPNRYDMMIKITLTKSSLKEFDNSNIHKKWKTEYGNLIQSKTIFDCDE